VERTARWAIPYAAVAHLERWAWVNEILHGAVGVREWFGLSDLERAAVAEAAVTIAEVKAAANNG
jgi:hypothetical protein